MSVLVSFVFFSSSQELSLLERWNSTFTIGWEVQLQMQAMIEMQAMLDW
jgi:hypothetical protein